MNLPTMLKPARATAHEACGDPVFVIDRGFRYRFFKDWRRASTGDHFAKEAGVKANFARHDGEVP